MSKINQDLIDTVRRLDGLSLQHRVEFNARTAVEFFRQQNDGTSEMIEAINAAAPANNSHKFDIGREYSRVIYVKIVHGYMAGDIQVQLADFDKVLNKLADDFDADEIDRTDGVGSTEWRFWWD